MSMVDVEKIKENVSSIYKKHDLPYIASVSVESNPTFNSTLIPHLLYLYSLFSFHIFACSHLLMDV